MLVKRKSTGRDDAQMALFGAAKSMRSTCLVYRWRVTRAATILLCCLCASLAPYAVAQSSAPASLPPPSAQAQATLSACVTDPDGAEISGARIELVLPSSPPSRIAIADGDGCFRFPNLPPGDLKLIVTAVSFEPIARPASLHPGESLTLPPLILSPATENTSIQVNASSHDLAQAEMKAEETQRLVGFYPNFFVTYDWHAAPLNTRQKFELSWKSTIDPANMLVTAAVAGVQQGLNEFSAYGQGAQGYGRRFGAALADSTIGNMLGGAVFPMLFRQDPRYFYKGTGTVFARASYAIAASVICRGDNGKWQPNYSSVAGDLAAGALSNLYYPANERNGATLTIENGLLGTVGDAVSNLFEEFLSRKLTPHAPHYTPTTSGPTITP